jgi:hypothetical protein
MRDTHNKQEQPMNYYVRTKEEQAYIVYTLEQAIDNYKEDMTRTNYLLLSLEVYETHKRCYEQLIDKLTFKQYQRLPVNVSLSEKLQAIAKVSKSEKIHSMIRDVIFTYDRIKQFTRMYPKDQGLRLVNQ